MTPEPYQVTGGPFDFKITRYSDFIQLVVVGDKGDVVTQIVFSAKRLDDLLMALMKVK